MNLDLIEKLSGYCDFLLGDVGTQEVKKKKKNGDVATPEVKKKKRKKEKKDEDICEVQEDCQFDIDKGDSVANKATNNGKRVKDDFSDTKPSVTDDGFKIVSDVPPDDTDISDAFASDDGTEWGPQVVKDTKKKDADSQNDRDEGTVEVKKKKKKKKKKDDKVWKVEEDFKSDIDNYDVVNKASRDEKEAKDNFFNTKPRMTDDGFKIVSDIPPDDSDISDAFESNDEAKWNPEVLRNVKSKDADSQKDRDIGTLEVKKKKKKDNEVCKMKEDCKSNINDDNVVDKVSKDEDLHNDRDEGTLEVKKKKKKDDEIWKMEEDFKSNNDDVNKASKDEKEAKGDFSNTKPKMTDDGFKIVSDIPPDDSDISDAFETDDEAEWDPRVLKDIKSKVPESHKDLRLGNTNAMRVTDDGFKIVSSVPEDDTDVSDAFESDLDEDELQVTTDRHHTPSDSSSVAKDCDKKDKSLLADGVASKSTNKKALQRMIADFDIGTVLLKKKDKSGTLTEQTRLPNMKPSETVAGRRKVSGPVQVLDYSKKRGTHSKKRKLSTDKPAATGVVTNTDGVTDMVTDEATMKKTRFEVFKFGMSGFDKTKKKETKEALAIRLGAKPRKNELIPYKQLMEMKKEEKVKVREDREMQRKLGYEVKKIRKNKRRDPNKVAGFDSQMGKFDGGALVLNKKDVANIKRTRH